jgi:PAS domain S-box-containing protein
MSERPEENERDEPGEAEVGTSRRLTEGVSTHAIFMLDAEGDIMTWPGPAQTLYGYDSADVLGRKVTVLFADGTEPDSVPGDLLRDPRDGFHEATALQCRADGSEFWATLTLTPLDNEGFRGYAVVSRDATTQRQETQRLKRQNDRLKEFTDILAHDLRNPLQAIEGQLDLYRETGETPHLDTVAETTTQMEALVDDLLTVAKHGSAVADPDQIDIGVVIQTAWDAVGKQSTDASLRTEDIGPVYADPDRLRQLFENLFRNAVEHGGTTVTVSVGLLDTGFYVEDDGPGIADDVREQVFDHGFTTSQDGTGYGLSIVRTVVNAHGWDIAITEGEAGGARFEITGIENLDHRGSAGT